MLASGANLLANPTTLSGNVAENKTTWIFLGSSLRKNQTRLGKMKTAEPTA